MSHRVIEDATTLLFIIHYDVIHRQTKSYFFRDVWSGGRKNDITGNVAALCTYCELRLVWWYKYLHTTHTDDCDLRGMYSTERRA